MSDLQGIHHVTTETAALARELRNQALEQAAQQTAPETVNVQAEINVMGPEEQAPISLTVSGNAQVVPAGADHVLVLPMDSLIAQQVALQLGSTPMHNTLPTSLPYALPTLMQNAAQGALLIQIIGAQLVYVNGAWAVPVHGLTAKRQAWLLGGQPDDAVEVALSGSMQLSSADNFGHLTFEPVEEAKPL